MGDPNCYRCVYCLDNCFRCPDSSGQLISIAKSRRKKIWKQSRMSSSQMLLFKRSAVVSRLVGQGACPTMLGQAGGPGDLWSAVQTRTPCGKGCSYNMGRLRNRQVYNNRSGVDRKYGSYQRYLARRVGGVFRKEKAPNVVSKTSWRGQPRSRTGTKACCKKPTSSKLCEEICAQATLFLDSDGINFGYAETVPSGLDNSRKLRSCESLSDLTRLYWNDTTNRFYTYYGNGADSRHVYGGIVIWDGKGNTVTYGGGDSQYVPGSGAGNGYCWNERRPDWITNGVTIEVSLDAPCCANRIPNCDASGNFTAMKVKNRTCVAQRCRCCGR